MIHPIGDCLLQILFLAPFFVLGIRTNKNLRAGILLLALLLFIATSVTTDFLSGISLFEAQKWNWGGKTIALLIALFFIYSYRLLAPKQFGLTAEIETRDAKYIFSICTGYFLLRFLLYITMIKEAETFHFETILYQSTVAGITEEVIFRGVLLTLLNQVFLNPKWIFAKVSVGWPVVMTSFLFGFTHGIYFDNGYHIHFDFFTIARITFDGFLFALLVEKTKSLLPAIILHNMLNLIGNH